jgi:Zn-dependent membrane protease YugP
MFFDPLYLMLLGPAMLLALWAQFKVKRAYKRYSEVPTARGVTGAEVAREILRANGIADVPIEVADGFLSDHYDPRSRTLRLSSGVYHGRSVAAAGIAAHEVGHAIQHARAYGPLVLRNTLAPVAMLGSNLAMILLMVGLFLKAMGLVYLGIIAFSAAVVFTLITLPVEFDASRRAKELLPQLGLVSSGERDGVASVLNAAALTYVAAAISAVLQLVYFLIRAGLLGGDRRD